MNEASPVAGFLPILALRFERTSFPIPGRVKDPVFLVAEMVKGVPKH